MLLVARFVLQGARVSIFGEILADSILLDNELKDGELATIDENEIMIAISKV